MAILGFVASALIGLSLGLIGGGGSILTVPILVYLFRIEASLATSYSLFIVGSTALLGSFRHYRLGNLQPKTALIFAIPSIVSSLLIRRLVLPWIPDKLATVSGFDLTKGSLLMLILALLMIWSSYSMIRRNSVFVDAQMTSPIKLAFTGLALGVVTGLLGAGGGFLIIPALLFFAGLPMKQAVGTSLLIIFLNATVAFAADLQQGVALDLSLLAYISLIAFAGMLIGTQLSQKIPGAKLKPAFGWLVLFMGLYVVVKEVFLS